MSKFDGNQQTEIATLANWILGLLRLFSQTAPLALLKVYKIITNT